jgi:hypothetical protein
MWDYFMTILSTRQEPINYCLRALGKPVPELNVDANADGFTVTDDNGLVVRKV